MKKIAKALAWIYGVYLALCLFVVLPALNIAAPRLVAEYTDRELRSELLLFNPFNLSLQARGVSLHEDDGHRPLAFRRFLIDLSLTSLWQPGIVFDRVWLDDLDLHILRYADGAFHFDDLIPEEDGAPPPDDSTAVALPSFTVRDLHLGAKTLTYTDRTRPGPFETVQKDLVLNKRDLTTVPDREGNGRLTLMSDGGGTLVWEGDLNLAASRSAGTLRLEAIDLSPIWRYEAQRLAFVVNGARIDLSLDYRADWSGDMQLLVSEGGLSLHSIDIEARDTERYPDTYVRLAAMDLRGISADLAGQTARAESLDLRGLEVGGFDEGDTISLADIFTDGLIPAEGEEASDPVAPEVAPEDAGIDQESAWQVALGRVTLDDSGIRWSTPYLAPERIEVRPLRLSAEGLAWPPQDASRFELALAINDTTRVDTQATLHLGTGVGDLHADIANVALPWFDPIVHDVIRTDLARGSLTASSDLTFTDFAPTRGSFTVDLVDFATVLHETGKEAFSLERLGISGAEVNLDEEELRVALIELEAPAGSLHILEDGTININGVVRGSGAPGENADETLDAGEDGDRGETLASAEEDTSAETASAWRVLLERAVLTGGRLDFADDSLPLPFQTVIGDIEAEVTDLDTAARTPLSVTLNGSVDGYAPVLIEGSGTPLGDAPDAQLRLDFRGMDIATMSPYSGTYAGYTIDSGTLSLDLRYALQGQAIEGDNRIVISQMQLGEPIESDLAVEVPLKLGLALLTDSRGVIDLAVPVKGNVDDPQFSLGKVIGGAVMNVITKAVTAPFKLLAGLVGSNRDLENIAFAPGSTGIDERAALALEDLAGALTERPQLMLSVGGSADPEADGMALRRDRLERELLDGGLSAESLAARDEGWAEAIAARYAGLAVPEGDTATTGDESDEATAPSPEQMYDALVAAVELEPRALQELGNERAAETKKHLVTEGGIAAERITIRFAAQSGDSAVHMEVQS